MDYTKMDPVLKTQWVEALRSGRYKQGRRALRRDDTYCCLGVLCDLKGLPFNQFEGGVFNVQDIDGMNYRLYAPLRLLPMAEQYVLGQLNDRPESFEKIAMWIEENL